MRRTKAYMSLVAVCFLLVGCSFFKNAVPAFHYNQAVKIVRGFYTGCSGVIDDYDTYTDGFAYAVYLTCPGDKYSTIKAIKESNLEDNTSGKRDK